MKARTLFALPYEAARTPLIVLNVALANRLAPDAAPRLAFERILGSLDENAGRLLGSPRIEHRGTRVRDRADKLARAVQLEQDADARRSAATDKAAEAEHRAQNLRSKAQRRHRDGLSDAAQTEAKETRAATAKAQTRQAKATEQADARAAAKLKQVEARRAAAENRARTQEAKATARAATKLNDAEAKRAEARKRRADANQLGQLAAAKRAGRKNS